MEINITAFVNAHEHEMERFSDSVANSGLEDIGQRTWSAALLQAMASPEYFAGIDHDALIEHFAEYGAWEREELEAQSDAERVALLIQFIAGDWRSRSKAEERGKLEHWEESEGGRLYQGTDGQWYYYVGC